VNVLVCVKRVPATAGKITLTADEQEIDTRYLGFTVSPHEECAVEEAVRIVEAHGGSSTVLTLGPAEASDQLREAMAVGVDRAILLQTDGGEWNPVATASAITDAIVSRMKSLASRAWFIAAMSTSAGRPSIFVSSWRAVIMSRVPATLKSMSPRWSSTPRMSVSVTNFPSWWMRPMAMPATGAWIGTPASIRDKDDPHTDAIDEDPFDMRTSETSRYAYGKSSTGGITGSNAFSARAP